MRAPRSAKRWSPMAARTTRRRGISIARWRRARSALALYGLGRLALVEDTPATRERAAGAGARSERRRSDAARRAAATRDLDRAGRCSARGARCDARARVLPRGAAARSEAQRAARADRGDPSVDRQPRCRARELRPRARARSEPRGAARGGRDGDRGRRRDARRAVGQRPARAGSERSAGARRTRHGDGASAARRCASAARARGRTRRCRRVRRAREARAREPIRRGRGVRARGAAGGTDAREGARVLATARAAELGFDRDQRDIAETRASSWSASSRAGASSVITSARSRAPRRRSISRCS